MTDLPTSAEVDEVAAPLRDAIELPFSTEASRLAALNRVPISAVDNLCLAQHRATSATYAPLVEAVLKTKALLAEYAKAPCFAEFLGDDYGENGCGCPVCALRTIDRILAALPLPEVTQ